MRWLVAAHEKEIPGFLNLAGGSWRVHMLGVGQFISLARLATLMANEKPEAVLLAGTAGSASAADIGKIFCSAHFAFPHIAGEDLPDFLQRAFTTTPAIVTAPFAAATVLQNHGVSIDAGKFQANQEYIPAEFPHPILENMEAASLALHCQGLGVRFSALLCVTNAIGADARTEWKNNFRSAGEKLAGVLPALLRQP